MKHGCMVMTLRLSSSRRSGIRPIQSASSPCWSFYSTSKALSKRNSYSLVKLSMASFTVRFWSDCGRAFGAKVQTSRRTTIGFSTTTTCPLTRHSLFDNSWLPKSLQWFLTPPYSPDLAPATFSYSPRWNEGWKNVVLTRLRRSTQNRKRLSTHSHLRTSRDAWNYGKQRWARRIHAQGDYFEGDGGN